MHLASAIPVLRIFSEEKAREFYLDFLGFSVDWQHRFGDDFPIYLQVRRADLVLHLSEHHGDASPGSTVFVPTQQIAAYQQELAGKDYRYAKPELTQQDWGVEMIIGDPFGNRIRLCERP